MFNLLTNHGTENGYDSSHLEISIGQEIHEMNNDLANHLKKEDEFIRKENNQKNKIDEIIVNLLQNKMIDENINHYCPKLLKIL